MSQVTAAALLLLETTMGLFSSAESAAFPLSAALGAIGVGLQAALPIIGAVPAVGGLLRAAANAIIFLAKRTASKVFNKGERAEKARDKFETASNKVAVVDGLFLAAKGVLIGIPGAMSLAVNGLVAAHKCAFDSGEMSAVEQLEDVFAALQTIARAIRDALAAIGTVMLGPIGSLTLGINNFLPDLDGFKLELEDLRLFLIPFEFLATILDYPICLGPIPCFTVRQVLEVVLGLVEWLFRPLQSILGGLIPEEVSFPVPTFDFDLNLAFLDPLLDDLDALYDDLLPRLRKPREAIENLLDDLQDMMPDVMPGCALFSDEFVNAALGIEPGDEVAGAQGDTGERRRLHNAPARALARNPALVQMKDFLESATWGALLAATTPATESKARTESHGRRDRRKKQGRDSIAGEPKIQFSLAQPITVMQNDLMFRDGYPVVLEENGNVQFAVSTNLRVTSMPSPDEKGPAHLELSYELTDEDGNTSKGPRCFMDINKNGQPTPILDVEESGTSKQVSGDVFALDFSPGGNPWKPGWEMHITAQLLERNKMPRNLKNGCNECPVGALCLDRKRGRRELASAFQVVRGKKRPRAARTALFLAFPPEGPWFINGIQQGPSNKAKLWEVYYDRATYGPCVLKAKNRRWTTPQLFRKVCEVRGSTDAFKALFDTKLLKTVDYRCEEKYIDLNKFKNQYVRAVTTASCAQPANCKVLNCGPQHGWSVSAPPSNADIYHVEHIFDENANDHGYNNVVNSYANWVWAWGKWNSGVSSLGTLQTYNPETRAEKRLVYGSDEFDAAEELVNECSKWVGLGSPSPPPTPGVNALKAAGDEFCPALRW